ncbi:MAG TPA: type III pantothenate kinase, partial [Solirubrobacterales bacterium]|nr:type III pantothenate kinase [Solirubrobacterales bacterium]
RELERLRPVPSLFPADPQKRAAVEEAERFGDELGERIAGLFDLCGMSLEEIDAVCVSSVVPPLGSQYERLTERYLDARCLTIGPGVKTGMPIRIDNPLEVGADRLVNAIAAYERFGTACVVVDFGTGLNVDAVSAEGDYLGGAIGPGLEISLTALIDRAARITRLDLGQPETAIGRSSRAAINSGFVFGFAGMIDGIVRRIEEELPEPKLLATGGLASAIVPYTETIEEVDDLLTLKGLRLIHERNAPGAD